MGPMRVLRLMGGPANGLWNRAVFPGPSFIWRQPRFRFVPTLDPLNLSLSRTPNEFLLGTGRSKEARESLAL